MLHCEQMPGTLREENLGIWIWLRCGGQGGCSVLRCLGEPRVPLSGAGFLSDSVLPPVETTRSSLAPSPHSLLLQACTTSSPGHVVFLGRIIDACRGVNSPRDCEFLGCYTPVCPISASSHLLSWIWADLSWMYINLLEKQAVRESVWQLHNASNLS